MEKKTQNQPNNKGNASKSKKYDVFISYRRLPRKDPQHRHATSLARSIAQQFELEGYSAFFDCWTDTEEYERALKKSKYYIILFTPYSFDGKEEGEEDNFKVELDYIKEGVCNSENNKESVIYTNDNQKTHLIGKENVLLINIDGLSSTKSIKKFFSNSKKEFLGSPIIELKTNSSFSIKELINTPEHDGRKRIKKFPRFSYKLCKKLSWCAIILIPLLCVAMGCILYQCFSKPVIFAGGGTVQNYIAKEYGIDVSNYRHWLGWKYIHIPSKDAWSLLWDDFTEVEKNRYYWPLVLSAEKIDDSIRKQKKQLDDLEVVGYEAGTASLKVQIIDNNKDSSYRTQADISLEELCERLKNDAYIVHTTTEHSATYNTYKKLLHEDCNFNLDSLIQKQGRKDFTLTSYESNSDKNHIFLANNFYYYTFDKADESVLHTKTQATITMPLFVYTIARKMSGTQECKLCPQVDKFFRAIKCNTDTTITVHPDKITMLKSKK